MKYYIGEVHERNGDLEYDTKYLFATAGDPDEHSKRVAMEWRGGCWYRDWETSVKFGYRDWGTDRKSTRLNSSHRL